MRTLKQIHARCCRAVCVAPWQRGALCQTQKGLMRASGMHTKLLSGLVLTV